MDRISGGGSSASTTTRQMDMATSVCCKNLRNAGSSQGRVDGWFKGEASCTRLGGTVPGSVELGVQLHRGSERHPPHSGFLESSETCRESSVAHRMRASRKQGTKPQKQRIRVAGAQDDLSPSSGLFGLCGCRRRCQLRVCGVQEVAVHGGRHNTQEADSARLEGRHLQQATSQRSLDARVGRDTISSETGMRALDAKHTSPATIP